MKTILDELHWFAVQTRPGSEAVAESGLRALGVETLLPRMRRLMRHATRTPKMAVRALFAGYLFARFCPAEFLRAVRCSRGVLRVPGAGGRPWIVDEAIIASLRERLGPGGIVELAERPFRSGDSVKVTAGPLAGWCGIFDRQMSDAQRVVILMEALQQGCVVMPRDCLELANAA